jgi:hypothetical protein
MPIKNSFVGFGAGLVAGVVATIALSGGQEIPRAMAQDPQPAASHRYLMQSWAYPAAVSPTTSYAPGSGAYILDTQSGKVWVSKEGGRLQSIGEAR